MCDDILLLLCSCLQMHPKIKACQPFPSFPVENALFLIRLDVHSIFTMFIPFTDRSVRLFVLMMNHDDAVQWSTCWMC